jgi:hypothetical protein
VQRQRATRGTTHDWTKRRVRQHATQTHSRPTVSQAERSAWSCALEGLRGAAAGCPTIQKRRRFDTSTQATAGRLNSTQPMRFNNTQARVACATQSAPTTSELCHTRALPSRRSFYLARRVWAPTRVRSSCACRRGSSSWGLLTAAERRRPGRGRCGGGRGTSTPCQPRACGQSSSAQS